MSGSACPFAAVLTRDVFLVSANDNGQCALSLHCSATQQRLIDSHEKDCFLFSPVVLLSGERPWKVECYSGIHKMAGGAAQSFSTTWLIRNLAKVAAERADLLSRPATLLIRIVLRAFVMLYFCHRYYSEVLIAA